MERNRGKVVVFKIIRKKCVPDRKKPDILRKKPGFAPQPGENVPPFVEKLVESVSNSRGKLGRNRGKWEKTAILQGFSDNYSVEYLFHYGEKPVEKVNNKKAHPAVRSFCRGNRPRLSPEWCAAAGRRQRPDRWPRHGSAPPQSGSPTARRSCPARRFSR